MADESSASFDVKRLYSPSDLFDFLEKENLLTNSEVFLHEFLGVLIAYLKDKGTDYPFIQIKGVQLVAAEVFDHLPDLLSDTQFLEALQLNNVNPDSIRRIREDFDISFLVGAEKIDDRTSLVVRFVEKTNSFEAIERIKRFYRQIQALRGETALDVQPEYSQALKAAIAAEQTRFDKEKEKIRESTELPSGDLKLDSDIQSQLLQRWKSLTDSDKERKEKSIVQNLRSKTKQVLSEELEKWRKEVFALQDTDVQQKVSEIQLEQDIQGLLGKKGLLELFILWSGTHSPSDFLESLEHFCTYLIEPFNPRRGNSPAEQVSFDLEIALGKLERALEEIQKYLEEIRKKKQEAAEKAFSHSVASTLLGASVQETSAIDGGGSDTSDETLATSGPGNITVGILVSRWQQVSEAWRSAWTFIEQAPEEDSKKRAILSLLRDNNLQPHNLLAGDFDFASLFDSLSPEARQKSHEQAQTILNLLPEFYPEEREMLPQNEQVRPLRTAFGEDTAKDAQGLKLMSLGQISRSKAELVAFTLLQLQRRLEAEGYSEAEIRAYIDLYEAQISAQIWMKILEKNGLQQTLTFQDLILIEKEITDQYFVFVTQAFPPKNSQKRRAFPPLDEQDLLRAYLSDQGLDAEFFLGQFSHENIQKALQFTQEFSKLSFEERVNIVTHLLQGKMDQATATNLARVFIALSSGGSAIEYAGILDALALQMYQKNWSQLSPSDQNRLAGLIENFYENMEVFGLVFGLSELRLLKTEVSQLQDFLQRIQKFSAREDLSNTPLLRSIGSFAPTTADDPSQRSQTDIQLDAEIQVSSTRNVTLQVSVLFAVQIQEEVRDNLLTLVMQRPISMQEFGGLLEFAKTGQQPAEPIDARLLAQFENLSKMQQEDPEAFAAQQQQAYQQFAQAENQRKRLQVAFKLMKAAAKAYAGNPTELLALLSDKESREIIQKEITKWGVRIGGAAVGGATYAALAPIIHFITAITSALTNLGLIGRQAGGAASELASSGSILGSEGAQAVTMGASKELAGLQNAAAKAWTSASQIPSKVSSATSTLGIGKSLAFMAFSSLFGPILLVGFLTLIVITVIGSSLNDFPSGVVPNGGLGIARQGRLARFNGRVCWPTDGHISQLDGPNHDTWLAQNAGTALDIGGVRGTPIYTPYAGTVRTAGAYENLASNGYGYWVWLDTDDGFPLIFAHMAGDPTQYLVDKNGDGQASERAVVVGGRLEAGDPIGLMGHSGTGAIHLHYEVPEGPITIRDIIPPVPPLPPPGNPLGPTLQVRVGLCGQESPPVITPNPDQPSPEDLLNGNYEIPSTP